MRKEKLIVKIAGQEVSDYYPDLISLEVEIDREAAAVFNLNLPLRLNGEGRWSFLDNEELRPWAEVRIEAGFDNEIEEIFRGFITHIVPTFETELSQSFLAVRGMDMTAAMDTEEKIQAWPNMKDSDIARKIFSSYNLQSEVQNTGATHEVTVSTILQRDSDIRFLKKLARRNGYECFVEAGKAFFRPPDLNQSNPQVLAIHFNEETNVGYLKAEVNAMRPLTAITHELDPLTRQERRVAVSTSNWRVLGKDAALACYPSQVPVGLQILRNGVAASPEQLQTWCQAQVNDNSWFIEVQGKIAGNLYGNILKPRRLVTIKGMGERFSGRYYVINVRHIFSPFGYDQSFRAVRNALGVDGTENFSVSSSFS